MRCPLEKPTIIVSKHRSLVAVCQKDEKLYWQFLSIDLAIAYSPGSCPTSIVSPAHSEWESQKTDWSVVNFLSAEKGWSESSCRNADIFF